MTNLLYFFKFRWNCHQSKFAFTQIKLKFYRNYFNCIFRNFTFRYSSEDC